MTARKTRGTTRRRCSRKPGHLAAGLFGVGLASGLVWLALDTFTGWTPGWVGFAAGVVAGAFGVRTVLLLVFRPFVALNKAMAAPRMPRIVWPHETRKERRAR
ncbi:MAG: hypothetical protein GEV11_18810 [Streptosporangiales bacterium]|nr:hypothetical protein [Streptosporangiales bacterium]